jgi:hypothetical protein
LVLNLLWQPSGAHRTAQKKSALDRAFALIDGHPAFMRDLYLGSEWVGHPHCFRIGPVVGSTERLVTLASNSWINEPHLALVAILFSAMFELGGYYSLAQRTPQFGHVVFAVPANE